MSHKEFPTFDNWDTLYNSLEAELLASRRYSKKCGCQSVSAMHVRLASTEFDERCNLLCQWCRDSQVRLVSTQHWGQGECVGEQGRCDSDIQADSQQPNRGLGC